MCRAEQQKQAKKESQLPDLPTTITDTNINPNDEGDILQNLPMEMTTIHMESSLTVETTSKTGTTNVQENNPALNVETVTGNTPDLPKVATNVALNVETDKETQKDDLPPGANVALNVETDKETQKDGLSHGLNVETSLTDSSQQPVESDVRGLNVETEANMVEKMDGEIQTTETGATQEWQEDIEHLTDVTTEVNRTNAAIGLLLLNSPRSTHMDTEDEELVENELLMPVGGEKQPDLVMEIEQQNKNKTSTNTMDPTTLNNTPEGQDDVDSDGTIILETQDAGSTPDKPRVGTKSNEPKPKPKKRASNGTLVIRSYKLRCKPDIATSQKNKKKHKPTVTGSKKNQNVPKLDNRPTTNKYKIKRTKQNGMTYYHCGYCIKVFDSLQHLNNHHKRNHDPVMCDVCNKNFATPNTLIWQAYGHLTKQYGCELCDQTFHFHSEVT